MKVKALSPALGAEVTGIDLSGPLDDAKITDLRAIWLEHQMIVIRGQDLTPAQQLAFAKALGEPDIYPFLTGLDGFPMITEVLKKEDEKVNFGGVGIQTQPIKNARRWRLYSMPRNYPHSVAIHYLLINMQRLQIYPCRCVMF